ncbi:hypothetical protein TanjilG_15722 [Lupinus angustifolius]|uniref:Calmodulin-binding domain-containing protein n=1 Tax=Lupinus angustifolius TaxID=3871 RepID=A0A1J7HNG2_LUPAN|nr:PREDICTED: ESF1 homolog [Lupinus angustifolius]OIW14368.1 hypothetical protein TanjilG_15722 [Lupinus angustifolius]
MEVKAKNSSSIVGKEKKTPSSNSHIINGTKKTTKPLPQKTSSSTNPNYVKLKIRSQSESESPSSFKNPKSDVVSNKDNVNRRRSFDRPQPSSSNLSKQNQPSLTSRLQKALVSPGPHERKLSVRSSIVPVRNPIPTKNISNKIGSNKNLNDGKIKQVYVAKSTKKNTPNSVSTPTNIKKENNDHASPKMVSNIENEEVKEVTNEEVEVIKVANEENKVDHVSELSPKVLNCGSDCELDYVESRHEYDQGLEESDKPHIQDDDKRVISTMKEETKIEDDQEKEENKNHMDINNKNNTSHKEEDPDAEEVMVNEKEDGGDILINDHIHTSENNNEEEKEGETSEIVVEKIKVEETPQNQHGKKEPQLSNDVIEETTNKLLEQERKNKVRAMAGAFQTVIDYQTVSK